MTDKKKSNYLPRDISWMFFNNRILQQAQREDVPLLERISFMGIYSNNLDEFFRVRIASLKKIAEYKDKTDHLESKEAVSTLKRILSINELYSKEFSHTINALKKELNKNQIYFLDETEFDSDQKKYLFSYFKKYINGYIYPLWLSSIKSLINVSDDTFYMAVRMIDSDNNIDYSLINLPYSGKNRFVELPSIGENRYFVYIEDIIKFCLPFIFKQTRYIEFFGYTFTFNKDAEFEIDNDINVDSLQKISKALKNRKKGCPIRIIYDNEMPKELLKEIKEKFSIDKYDTVQQGGHYQNYKDLIYFPNVDNSTLKYKPWPPIEKYDLYNTKSIIEAIEKKDRFIHIPYHSFDSFIRILQEAAFDKNVKEIKISLYRVAKDSKVVKALIGAARNGKKVTVVIEIMARFDEASNIDWSKQMQDAGIKVLFGVEGLKIHSKIMYINMHKDKDIACVSTGNFHEGNAKVYTDYILMTADKSIVKDVKDVFEFITKPYIPFNPKVLLVSPNKMKNRIIAFINKEIHNASHGKTSYIKVKINHITDDDIIEKLYEASSKGVKLDLLVRGNCSIITGIKGLSDNIKIRGIIDRFLEHSRIYIFANGGDEKIYIGSADWMTRNLDNRIEVVTPIFDEEIKEDLRKVVDFGLNDNVNNRIVDGTGENKIDNKAGNLPFRSQEELYNHYKNI